MHLGSILLLIEFLISWSNVCFLCSHYFQCTGWAVDQSGSNSPMSASSSSAVPAESCEREWSFLSFVFCFWLWRCCNRDIAITALELCCVMQLQLGKFSEPVLISDTATALDIMMLMCFFKKNNAWMNANAGDGMVIVFGTTFFFSRCNTLPNGS